MEEAFEILEYFLAEGLNKLNLSLKRLRVFTVLDFLAVFDDDIVEGILHCFHVSKQLVIVHLQRNFLLGIK